MTKVDRTARVQAKEAVPQPSKSEVMDRQGINEGMRVLSYLIAGPLLYGGLGWLGDRMFGTEILVAAGVLVGTALSIILIIRRYSRES